MQLCRQSHSWLLGVDRSTNDLGSVFLMDTTWEEELTLYLTDVVCLAGMESPRDDATSPLGGGQVGTTTETLASLL